jgi:homocysteine S-methyltransferase
MGTELLARGLRADECLDMVNLTQPETVQQIHRDYIAAGAEIIATNSFGANRFRLEPFGLADRVREINRAAATIAREARDIMGEPAFVAGSVGPSGALFHPIGPVTLAQVADAVSVQVEALVEKGVDLLTFETFTNLNELVAVIEATRRITDLPIVAQMSFDDYRRTASGHDVAQVVEALDVLGVPVVGVNCGIGPQQAIDLIAQFAGQGCALIAAQPNAGYPVRVGGRAAYLATPEYFAAFAETAVSAGAVLVGGCCGTTPAHIQAMRGVLRADSRPSFAVAVPSRSSPPATAVADAEPRTRLGDKLACGDFVISVEVDPPKGSNPAKALRGAAQLKDAGVDTINIGDSPMAKARMSCLSLGILIQQQVGVDPLIHFTSRDRNLMALQADLLGMHALGIRHILALTGDDLRASTNPPVKTVWDVDSIGLIGMIKRLNVGIDYGGSSIGRPTRFLVGCAVSPNHDDIDGELNRFERKVAAGADFTMSQPLFSMDQLNQFIRRAGNLPIPHILGVVPLESHRQAELLHHEVPGFSIPPDIRERMRRAGDRGVEEGLRIADEFIQEARNLVSGVYIITSYGRYDAATALVRTLASSTSSNVSIENADYRHGRSATG